MASRKHLKKSIKNVTGSLFADCVALTMCQQGNGETLEALMREIIELNTDFVTRISHTERGAERAFYQALCKEFTEKANDLSERIIKA